MLTASQIIEKYITFFEKRGHQRISNSPLIPQNDPTTLFTSSGMQPLVPYLLGEPHPQGKRLVNVQNSFRAQDIDEIGDNRHTTFFRMLGNWSLGDYFKNEQLPWLFTFLTDSTEGLGLSPEKLYVTVFEGYKDIPKDMDSVTIWTQLFKNVGLNPKERIFYYGTDKNWWSRAGSPEKMPNGEPGGPSSEVFFDFETEHDPKFGEECHLNCDCGRYIEIANSVFMQYKKENNQIVPLAQKNVDFGGGLERLLLACENIPDVFQTSLFKPIITTIEQQSNTSYQEYAKHMRIITDHFISAVFIAANGIIPSNKDQGYILRRLIRRGVDHLHQLDQKDIAPIIESIVDQYKTTDPYLLEQYESIRNSIIEESQKYKKALDNARLQTDKELKRLGIRTGDELMGTVEIPADIAFKAITSYGLSPTQLQSLGYSFNTQALAEKIKEHQTLSRSGATQKFAGGLADHQEATIKGHTATHLLHQALRDVLGTSVHQTGSNITAQRLRFDFNYDMMLSKEQLQQVEDIVNAKIADNLAVHFEMLPVQKAKELGAIGLFDDKYEKAVKVYFIGDYSKEFCGGPHVEFTGKLKNFKIVKQENLGQNQKRIYATVE